ncbi:MAG: hypothetical protein ISR84_01005 [Kiritimatiellales bacterium]|nr:hypothetical protein [Kiritimatiellales bacterium]
MKKRIGHIALTLIAGFIILQSTGCAFGTRKVCLEYTPSSFPPMVPNSPTVLIHAPEDARHEDSLGCVRNGWGMKTARVEAKPGQPTVSTWITQALSYDLGRAGCSVIRTEPKDGTQPDFTIDGSLQRVYVDCYMSMEGEISMELCLKNKDRVALDRHYRAEGKKVNWWASSGEFQKTLDLTLQDLMERMLPEITTAMLKKYEDLPPAAAATGSISEKLSKLKKLKEDDLITEEEYEVKKEALIEAL